MNAMWQSDVDTEVYIFQRAKHLQQHCGDQIFIEESASGILCALVDGLGSGKEAEKAAKAVTEAIDANSSLKSLADIVARSNEAVAGLRGAAIAVWRADWAKQKLTYCGIGNIRFYMLGEDDKLVYPISSTGFLSGRKQKIRTQEFSYRPGSTFLMHSDGLTLAGVKKHLHARGSIETIGHNIESNVADVPEDDVTFLVGRMKS
ncbi:SpoIIE family protein phosphatase [Listeria rocourtiae]|uniref:Negative regulator of sigma-B (Phosphoserine phosphatase) n=2 Tax=Listeria rocourtiae TaxID=647910 RepID=A0A4R6ZSM3_9LIST|nr:PP2C family serine/threonine-protein phosphatase [Listeria rocourtiae]EUJ43849.1 indirect negative regulation of sigma B dependent gene expression [Listeria rocourtiae FSL F6-920]MBC1435740.1 SpoIIE family protein phosphatase [Listeria rocourtiae]MBC1605595.1 SpoIIE family protein phosphatase [Listeria rocourtiae]TDR55605.1 negative regulator of sigma-B (phosphoserine phosphatase) [Listeria rocourtiae]